MKELIIDLPTLAATRQFAEQVAELAGKLELEQALTIALNGTLGAGKTQWVRYFCSALGVPSEQVTSPTYVLLQRYAAARTIYHFDFYRLESDAEVWDLGIDELYEHVAIVLIEWAEKFTSCLPDDCLLITFVQSQVAGRAATISATGRTSNTLLNALH